MAEVVLKAISKSFLSGRVKALTDITMEVKNGEFVTILGPSGCGKSTLLRIIAGLETPDNGDVFIDSRRVNDIEARNRDIAMVFQSYALYPHMNIYNNIATGLRIRKIPADEIGKRVRETSKKLDIEDLLLRKPKQLSGGQRQRVALARALVRKPKVFLLDEPLSNLDASLRENMRAELKILFRDMKATVVYVTHDQTEAMTMSDKIIVLESGRIQQIGDAIDIYNQPRNLFVAGFIGTPKMNFIEGRIENGYFISNGNELRLGLPGIKNSKDIIAGIRPQDIEILHGYHNESIPAKIILSEPLGSTYIITIKLGNIVLKVVNTRPPMSENVSLKFNYEKVYLFSKLSGSRLK